MMSNSEARKRAAENEDEPYTDEQALADLVFYGDMDSAASMRSARIIAKHILASDWLAAHTAAAEVRGAERVAEAIEVEIRRFGRTDASDPVRAGLIEGYRDAAGIARKATS